MSIDVVGLEKKFGDVTVVCGIDVHVPNGKMLVLLGPSGCGKTTTMRCIAGLDTPSKGSIEIAGNVVYDAASGVNVPVERRHVGMVFQSYAIWPHLTVFQNVAFPLEIQRVGKAETAERVHDMLALVGLGDYAARGASQLSGGQMQRVALARSLINKPAVLLLDEPLSNLDARLRDYLRVQLREIQMQLAITAVYVTHDQHEALALADEIVVLRAGTILQRGEPIDLYGHPCSSAVAEFLGYSNIFTANVTSRDGASADVTFETGNERIRGTLVASQTDAVVAACVRPNDIRIAALADAAAALPPNTFAAEITLASFEGSHIHYQARCTSGVVWDVVCADVAGALRVGSTASIHVAPESVLLLPQDQA
jgi:iron(III) transport system ATP-binding protein